MIKKFLGLGLFLAAIGGVYAFWMYNKPHEDIRKMKADATYGTEALILEFTESHDGTDAFLTDKIILVEGQVTKIKSGTEQSVFTFDYGHDYMIQAYLPLDGNDVAGIESGASVKIKCKYSGYLINDEDYLIPADIKLEKCYIQN